VTYLKVAEMQARGSVHFHAEFRLDSFGVRRVLVSGGELEVGAVAGYLAKHVTRSVLDGGALDHRILTADQLDLLLPRLRPHPARLVETAWQLGGRPDCAGLRRWAHSYGYGGHWLTKSRRYSTTFTERRLVRRAWRQQDDRGDERAGLGLADQVLDDEERVLKAADQARSRRETARAAKCVARDAARTT
jgi:hypothetical protein